MCQIRRRLTPEAQQKPCQGQSYMPERCSSADLDVNHSAQSAGYRLPIADAALVQQPARAAVPIPIQHATAAAGALHVYCLSRTVTSPARIHFPASAAG